MTEKMIAAGDTFSIDRQEKNETGPDKKDGIPYPGSMA